LFRAKFLVPKGLNKIIGGEWHKSNNPDFLWTPPINTKALTQADHYLKAAPLWNGLAPLSKSLKYYGAHNAKSGVPLAKIVESLVRLAQ
jgi:hypothetical protein